MCSVNYLEMECAVCKTLELARISKQKSPGKVQCCSAKVYCCR